MIPLDKADRFVGKIISKVLSRGNWLVVFENPGAVALGFILCRIAVFDIEHLGHVLMPPSKVPVKLLKTPLERVVFFCSTKMPFPNHPGIIAHFPKG